MNEITSLENEVELLLTRAINSTANYPALENFHHLLKQCQDRLKQPMRIAIVGVIKAGKSTLMNALLGDKVVATGSVEATFNINWLRYGNQPSLKVHFKDQYQRPPETKSIEELTALTLRAKENSQYFLSIKYIEVFYPQEMLKIFNIIDTPGLKSFYEEDSKNTQEFLQLCGDELTQVTQEQAAQADAVLYLFSQAIGLQDAQTVEAFQGPLVNNATPINAIGALTKVDMYASDPNITDPMAEGEKNSQRLMQNTQVNRLFYTIYPICGLLAEGAQTLTAKHWDILLKLKQQLPEKKFRSISRYYGKFTGDYNSEEVPISKKDREEIINQLGLYGISLAYDLISSGVNTLEQLQEELMKKTGIPELRHLILSHFGHRAFLIKLGTVLGQITTAYFQERQRLKGTQLQILEEIAGQFDTLQAQEQAFQELNVLRSYYEKKLDFDEQEEKQLLQITGENGNSCGERLGMEQGEQATVTEMLLVAEERMRYWTQRANDYMAGDRATLAAAKVLARSYERILYRVQKAKDNLYI
ncbi:dynamin family protein [Gloeothece verrucosa]|uniref:GTP-binding protein HSR1-related protein n=1 Tax=Gloeothece verrucosa (strain PCC 7822) TaxID=497965 RepID=E0UB84_GLOV7|nr:dynamin family protein [Gloeothece verrucosa]ADN16329.1 GTP-binding protein HSR1-related protein [Gloeothece verrucosa PCC 7822]